MRRIITLTFGILVATSLFWPVASRLGAEAQLVNRSRNLIAIDGYDPVAYFLQSAPIKGQTTFEYQ